MTCTCDKCAKSWPLSELLPCRDFWSRVQPGDTVPAGDCPECGAFCFPALPAPKKGHTLFCKSRPEAERIANWLISWGVAFTSHDSMRGQFTLDRPGHA